MAGVLISGGILFSGGSLWNISSESPESGAPISTPLPLQETFTLIPDTGNTVSSNISWFSVSISNVSYPNPYNYYTIEIANLPEDGNVAIYNESGDKVFDSATPREWLPNITGNYYIAYGINAIYNSSNWDASSTTPLIPYNPPIIFGQFINMYYNNTF